MSSLIHIQSLPDRGRCYFATQNIYAGQIMFTELPVAFVPDTESSNRCCSFCFKLSSNPLQNCSNTNCNLFKYCNSTCMSNDASQHALECTYFSYLNTNKTLNQLWTSFSNYTRLLLRLLIKGDLIETIWQLCSNSTSFSKTSIHEFCGVARVLVEFLIHSRSTLVLPEITLEDLPLDDFIENPYKDTIHAQLFLQVLVLVCKEECNSFGAYTFDFKGNLHGRQSYGIALYPKSVYFNHSCFPNVGHYTSTLGDIVFYALRDIKKEEEALICYVELDKIDSNCKSKRERFEQKKGVLRGLFHFDCACVRCTAESLLDCFALNELKKKEEYHLCQNEKCQGWYIPLVDYSLESRVVWKCIACKVTKV